MFKKSLFGSSVANCRLACFEILLSINEKAKEKARKRSDGVVPLAELYVLCYDRTCSFNQ